MILGATAIKDLILSKQMISPFDELCLQPASYDCRLGSQFKVPLENGTLSLSDKPRYTTFDDDHIVLGPHQVALAHTLEFFHIPAGISMMVHGRSSVGRMFLFIHSAGWVDPGFRGQITLELVNAAPYPLRLDVGRRLCQMVFARTETKDILYNGKYLDQTGATGSMIHKDEECLKPTCEDLNAHNY